MLLDTSAPLPVPEDAIPHDAAPRRAFPGLTADILRRTLLSETRPAVVLCGAIWAAPYRTQLRDIDQLARTLGDRFGFYTLDVLREEELAAWVRVRVLPTTLIFRGAQIVARFAGHVHRREIQSCLIAAATPECRELVSA